MILNQNQGLHLKAFFLFCLKVLQEVERLGGYNCTISQNTINI